MIPLSRTPSPGLALLLPFLVFAWSDASLVASPESDGGPKPLERIPCDLEIPPTEDGPAAAGKRVRSFLPGDEGGELYHLQTYGGDRENLFLAGFSRGAIACNYIGLHDNEIASLWRGFICHSHYDGVRRWSYSGSDRDAARRRLDRLGDRPQFISHERSVDETRAWLREVAPGGRFHFLALPWPDHTAEWVLRDVPARDKLRAWFAEHREVDAGDRRP